MIDGTTEADYQKAVGFTVPPDGTLAIAIDGSQVNDDGLVLGAGSRRVDDPRAQHPQLLSESCCIGLLIQSDDNVVQGNYIGTSEDGKTEVSNGTGIEIGSNGNTIGGSGSGEGNVISGNDTYGVHVASAITSVTGNVISGNFIGADVSGNAPLENDVGVSVDHGPGTLIGGATQADGNVIYGQTGIDVDGNSPVESDGSIIRWNNIGIGKDGITGFPLASVWGVGVDSADGVFVADNAIGHFEEGIAVAHSAGVTIVRNAVGTDRGGTTSQRNSLTGIDVRSNSTSVTIGGAPADGNVVRGNPEHGINLVDVNGSMVAGNTITGNGKGGGPADFAGSGDGIRVQGSSNTIGPTNTVTDNGRTSVDAGVRITGSVGSTNNKITQNLISQNAGLGINLGDDGDGLTSNDVGDGDTGPNDLQNFPVLTSASFSESTLSIQYTFQTAPVPVPPSSSSRAPQPHLRERRGRDTPCTPRPSASGATHKGPRQLDHLRAQARRLRLRGRSQPAPPRERIRAARLRHALGRGRHLRLDPPRSRRRSWTRSACKPRTSPPRWSPATATPC